jgi:hypothetical protein
MKLEFNNSSSGTFPLRLSNFLSSSLKSKFIFIKKHPLSPIMIIELKEGYNNMKMSEIGGEINAPLYDIL